MLLEKWMRMSKSVTAAALVVGTLALLFALVTLIWMISSHVEKDNSREELLGKLEKLEMEHVSRLKKLEDENDPVSYTHLTLPTNREV